MKIPITGLADRDGSVLMVTLFSTVLIGTVLASYLTLIRHQDVAVARSQAWNAALAMAEAGVEEALAQVNSGDLSANGWGPPAGGIYNLQSRALSPERRYDVKYFVTAPTNPPIIYSTGYVTIPALSVTVSRSITVLTKVAPVVNMNVAVGARNGITMTTGGLATDSFDSADPANNGHYPISNPSKQSTNGGVASLLGPINFGGNLNIKGDLFIGPAVAVPAGTVSGKIHTDFNADYPDVSAPAGYPGPPWVPAGVNTNGTYEFKTSGKSVIGDGSAKIVVWPGVDVRLYVTTPNFKPAGIEIRTNSVGSGQLTIYQHSGTATFPGSGNMAVQSERAENFQYFGMAGVTSVTNVGSYNFFGVIYAPSANIFLDGGWNSPPYTWNSRMNFVGTAIGKSILMNGYYTFHFDENLLRPGVSGGGNATAIAYMASSWKENL